MKDISRFHAALLASAAALLLAGCDYAGRGQAATDTAGVLASSGTAAVDSSLGARPGVDSGVAVPTDTVMRQPTDSQGIAPELASRAVVEPPSRVHVEVDITARQLNVFRDSVLVETHPVAVGSREWPTRAGQWNIVQVVWNPEWIPPDESWAEQKLPRKPGDPANPLGRAQLVYDPPRSIHGTNDPKSVGKAVSHGSIRVTNQVAQKLARLLMEETGAGRDSAWYDTAKKNRTVKQIIDLPQPVPIRVF
ncbi:MAG: L,D-transpeptidase [Gemmatimonas sp.]